MKNVFDGLISRLDIAKERITELKCISRETSKTEKQREKRTKKPKKTDYLKTMVQVHRV